MGGKINKISHSHFLGINAQSTSPPVLLLMVGLAYWWKMVLSGGGETQLRLGQSPRYPFPQTECCMPALALLGQLLLQDITVDGHWTWSFLSEQHFISPGA
jgi:hypothetical protein